MSIGVMAVILLAALLHATWNSLIRAGEDKMLTAFLIVAGAGLVTACFLPFVPIPAPASWPYLAASIVIHVVYFYFVAISYRGAELSFVYPIMRGSAPAISAVVVVFVLNESPSTLGWAGVLIVCSSIVLLTADSWRTGTLRFTPTAIALANAGVIVIYTVVDGIGARASGHAFSYTGWMILLTALPATIFCFITRPQFLASIHANFVRAIASGACTFGSYALALWAMTQAPIALVAALRETSVVFGTIIAATFLHEKVSPIRYLAILGVTAGAIAIKLS
ncbi:MAG TPA: DMT family transporter [Syntrophales bacterium]|nr:DMT family transporter [Syntrophales bacterium]